MFPFGWEQKPCGSNVLFLHISEIWQLILLFVVLGEFDEQYKPVSFEHDDKFGALLFRHTPLYPVFLHDKKN